MELTKEDYNKCLEHIKKSQEKVMEEINPENIENDFQEGVFNGIEFCLAILEQRESEFIGEWKK